MALTRSLTVRLVAIAVLWIAAALVAGGLLLANVFRAPLETAFDQRLDYLLESLLSAAEISANGQAATVRDLGEPRFDAQYSGLYWQIVRTDTGAVIGRSRSLWDVELDLPSLITGGQIRGLALAGPIGQQLRATAMAITDEASAGRFVFVVAADAADLDASIQAFLTALIWSLALLGLGLLVAVVLQVYVGLLPLRGLRQALQDVRDGRAERLSRDFPQEVQPLADELNGLLDHTREVLARARAHVGNLAHALKTPLSVLSNTASAPGDDMADIVGQQTAQMRQQIEHHLSRARAVGQGTGLAAHVPVAPVMKAIARTVEKLHPDRGLAVAVECPSELTFRGERNDLEEMLGNLCDNAGKWARRDIRMRAGTVSGTGRGGLNLRVTLEDDGPGVDPALHDELFARGRRADESKPGAGLGLAIVRDIAALYGGTVSLTDSELGGLQVTLELPGGERSG